MKLFQTFFCIPHKVQTDEAREAICKSNCNSSAIGRKQSVCTRSISFVDLVITSLGKALRFALFVSHVPKTSTAFPSQASRLHDGEISLHLESCNVLAIHAIVVESEHSSSDIFALLHSRFGSVPIGQMNKFLLGSYSKRVLLLVTNSSVSAKGIVAPDRLSLANDSKLWPFPVVKGSARKIPSKHIKK